MLTLVHTLVKPQKAIHEGLTCWTLQTLSANLTVLSKCVTTYGHSPDCNIHCVIVVRKPLHLEWFSALPMHIYYADSNIYAIHAHKKKYKHKSTDKSVYMFTCYVTLVTLLTVFFELIVLHSVSLASSLHTTSKIPLSHARWSAVLPSYVDWSTTYNAYSLVLLEYICKKCKWAKCLTLNNPTLLAAACRPSVHTV